MRDPRGVRIGAACRAAFYALLVGFAVGAPLWLAALDTPFIHTSPSRSFAVHQLVGFTGALAALAIAGLEVRRRRSSSLQALLPILLPLLLILHFLQRIWAAALRPWDYDVYEYAARVVLRGADPYSAGVGYIYPPLTAQALAAAYRGAARLQALIGLETDGEAVWLDVFYLHQCSQLVLVLAAYFLCQRFARALGLGGLWAHGLGFALLIANDALYETLWHGQVNLWLLDSSLAGLLLARRAPALGGLALAIGAHIKLYPLAMLWPLLVSRCARAMLWTGVAVFALALLQSDLGRDWTLFRQFLAHFTGTSYLQLAPQNNSLQSILWNFARMTSGGAVRLPPALLGGLSAAWVALAGGWLLLRTLARLRERRAGPPDPCWDRRLLLAGGAEALAFGLLVSPTVWPHEYLMAVPLAILAAALRGRERPVAVAAGILLVMGTPNFGIFPLSYRCTAGILMLLGLTRPGAAPLRAPAGLERQ